MYIVLAPVSPREHLIKAGKSKLDEIGTEAKMDETEGHK
jgi:hypothetical protein